MLSALKHLDDLLRGRSTGLEQISGGRITLPLRVFVPTAIGLGLIYGFFMGWYGLFNAGAERAEVNARRDRDSAAVESRPVEDGEAVPEAVGKPPEPAPAEDAYKGYKQLFASMIKFPALFLVTLVVTFPSLYVFNALVGCQLSFLATLRLLVGVIVVNLAVAASMGTILGFFTLSTTSYSFMVLLNVVLLTVAGVVGLGFLLHTLRRLAIPPLLAPLAPPTSPPDGGESTDPPAPARPLGALETHPSWGAGGSMGQASVIFRIWVVIYALVGAQTGYILRPFIGHPNLPFEMFRNREGNFFQAVGASLRGLLGP